MKYNKEICYIRTTNADISPEQVWKTALGIFESLN